MRDTVLCNAEVLTQDPAHPKAEWVAIEGDCIGAVGDSIADAPAGFHRVDCAGGTVLPGFVDPHVHLLAYASSLIAVDCSPAAVRDLAGLLGAIQRSAERSERAAYIRAVGYRDTELAEHRHPTRWEIDAVAPDNPVRLFHGSGHASVLNSRAVAAAAITGETEEPEVGEISRRLEDGEPDGLFLELEGWLDRRLAGLPQPGFGAAVAEADRRLIGAGIVAVHDMGERNDLETVALLEQLQREGSLSVQATAALGWEGFLHSQHDQHRGRWVKLVVTEIGGLSPTLDELTLKLRAVHRAGAFAAVHAVSQQAVELVVSAFEAVAAGIELRGRRHRIEHASVCPPSLAERIARLGVLAVTNTGFLNESGDRYLREIPAEELPFLYDLNGLAAAGVTVAAASDAPYSQPNPLASIRAAVTRRSSGGMPLPGGAASVQTAVTAHTRTAAYAAGLDSRFGSISVGRPAELVVLSGSIDDVREDTALTVAATVHRGIWCGDLQ